MLMFVAKLATLARLIAPVGVALATADHSPVKKSDPVIRKPPILWADRIFLDRPIASGWPSAGPWHPLRPVVGPASARREAPLARDTAGAGEPLSGGRRRRDRRVSRRPRPGRTSPDAPAEAGTLATTSEQAGRASTKPPPGTRGYVSPGSHPRADRRRRPVTGARARLGRAMQSITWENFDRLLSDGDVIRLAEADGPVAGTIEVVLMLGPRVTWWKEVRQITGDRATIARVTRSGRHQRPPGLHWSRSRTSPTSSLSKARFLGRKTEMYAVGNPAQKDGRQLTFSWETDQEPWRRRRCRGPCSDGLRPSIRFSAIP